MSIRILYAKIKASASKSLLHSNIHLFSEDYKEQLFRYRRWQDVQLSLIGKLLLKEGFLSYHKEIDLKELCFTKFKKPYFKNNDIQFNISHSGELVIVCLTDTSCCLGIDIEVHKSIKIEDFKGQMTDYETQKVFNSHTPIDEFFTYWTQKEAVIKAHGKGLSIPLKSFEIMNNMTSIDATTFYVSKIELEDNYTCHIAAEQAIHKESIMIQEIDIHKFIT